MNLKNFLQEIEFNKNINSLDSKIWIYKTEKIKENEKYYIRVNLVNKSLEKTSVEEIVFIKNNKSFAIQTFTINPKYKNENIFYCLLESSEEEKIEDSEIYIRDYTINQENYQIFSYGRYGNLKSLSSYERKALEKKYHRTIVYLPYIEEEYWLCSCGHHNHIYSNTCQLCLASLDDTKKLLKEDLEKLKIVYYLENTAIEIDYDKTLDENLKKYLDQASQSINVDAKKIKEHMDISPLEEKYKNIALVDYSKKGQNKKIALLAVIFLGLFLIYFIFINKRPSPLEKLEATWAEKEIPDFIESSQEEDIYQDFLDDFLEEKFHKALEEEKWEQAQLILDSWDKENLREEYYQSYLSSKDLSKKDDRKSMVTFILDKDLKKESQKNKETIEEELLKILTSLDQENLSSEEKKEEAQLIFDYIDQHQIENEKIKELKNKLLAKDELEGKIFIGRLRHAEAIKGKKEFNKRYIKEDHDFDYQGKIMSEKIGYSLWLKGKVIENPSEVNIVFEDDKGNILQEIKHREKIEKEAFLVGELDKKAIKKPKKNQEDIYYLKAYSKDGEEISSKKLIINNKK